MNVAALSGKCSFCIATITVVRAAINILACALDGLPRASGRLTDLLTDYASLSAEVGSTFGSPTQRRRHAGRVASACAAQRRYVNFKQTAH